MNYENIGVKLSSMVALLFFGLMIFLAGCNQEGKGFALPEGNVDNGKLLFSTLRCNECHSTSEIKWLGNTDDLNVPIGGDVTRVKSYGDLITSIINPSHKIAKGYEVKGTTAEGTSKMMIYNEIITVQELIDIVTYLQTEYNIVTPSNDYYHYYY
ncbi:MAG: c-type cytochrome [Saprospiraceae bacterium]|nr:c-type cytochrome [Saprospiraceae bacterium]